jgi:hypothetical protein
MIGWIIGIGVVVLIVIIVNYSELKSQLTNKQKEINNLHQDNSELRTTIQQWEGYEKELLDKEKNVKQQKALFEKLLQQRTKNFPLIGEVWSQLIKVTEEERARALVYKKNPAPKAAQQVIEAGREKRKLAKELTLWKYKAQNYEAIYPWLAEELEQELEDQVNSDDYFSVYTDAEREDPVTQFVNPEDYRKLSESDRNQLALDRYWQRGKKTKWMIGKMYERYAGYLYEKNGWEVEYFGIHKRYEDLGRDLIARKGNTIHVVQCKNWSKFKTIYENHIFQLFGTTYGFQKENPSKKVLPVFFCSTSLSETAEEFAKRLGIEVHQNHKFREYPCIKCNVSPKGDKIYHLPFDQQYDNTKVGNKGEFYAATVAEAESKGFRRAFRWSGMGNKQVNADSKFLIPGKVIY